MSLKVGFITRMGDKTGALGSLISGFGCAVCFPALASIGAALGMGFLAQWEGLFVHVLLPLFAALALLANLLGWFGHRQWLRTLLGVAGPLLVLITRYLLWSYSWRNTAIYIGLAMMLIFAVWDLFAPGHRRCTTEAVAG